MSVIDTLITDRTQADADRVDEMSAKGISGMTTAELSEYMAGMKGAYNAKDLNRVEEAMVYVAGRLAAYSYPVTLQARRTWARTDVLTPALIAPYLADLRTLRGALPVPGGTPSVPANPEDMTFEEANDIEKILADLDRLLTLMVQSFLRCGNATTYSGARGLPTSNAVHALTWGGVDALDLSWQEWDRKTWTQLLFGR